MKTLLAVLALAQISGSVYAPDGSVVPNMVVRANDKTATTDSNGAFTIADLQEGVVELEVDGLKSFALTGDLVTITTGGTQDVESMFPLPASGDAVIEGRVTLDGKPLANAPIYVQEYDSDEFGRVRVVSNAKGEFVAKGLASQQYTVVPDERLLKRLRWSYSAHLQNDDEEKPYLVDLQKSRNVTTEVVLHSPVIIRGRIVDSDRKPVAHARVKVVPANRATHDFAAASRTTIDGRYFLSGPPWSETEEVQIAVAPSLQSTTRSQRFVLGNANREIDITLPRAEMVRVRVTGEDRKPIANARVAFSSTSESFGGDAIARMLDAEPPAQRTMRTNAEGEIALRLSSDSYDFAAAAEGFRTGTALMRAITRPTTVELQLQRAAVLRGRVHRGDRGIANVGISIVSESNNPRNLVFTDSDGRFEIKGLVAGAMQLNAYKHDAFIDRTLDVEAPDEGIDIALPPAGTLRGRVIDAATGQPLPRFNFTITPVSDSELSEAESSDANEEGTFIAEIPPGSYRVSAVADGFARLEPRDVRITANETTHLDLPLGRGAIVSGRILDESGQPIASASAMINHKQHTLSEEDGTFTISGIEQGPAVLNVTQSGYLPYRKSIEVEASTTVEVHLSRGLTIQGIVTRGGKRIAGVQVGAETSAIGADHQQAETDDDGRFTLSGLIHAPYTISAYKDMDRGEIRGVDPTRQREITLSLDPRPHGVVYGAITGLPPAVGGKYTRRVVNVQGETENVEGWIDDTGNYRIENAPLGKARIMAYVESASRVGRMSGPKDIEILAGQPLRVDLDLGGNLRVSGRITADRKPLAGAYIMFTNTDGTMSGAQTSEDGSYEVMLARAGAYSIYARSEMFVDRAFRTSRDFRGGETFDIDLGEQVIEGTVIDATSRQPIAGAVVALIPTSSAAMVVSAEASSDANGRFRITSPVAGGGYRLVASAPGYAHRSQPFGGPSTQHSFELVSASDLVVRVRDARTGAFLDAYLFLTDESGYVPSPSRKSDDGTSYHFSLAPGKYKLTVFLAGYERKVIDVSAPGSQDVLME